MDLLLHSTYCRVSSSSHPYHVHPSHLAKPLARMAIKTCLPHTQYARSDSTYFEPTFTSCAQVVQCIIFFSFFTLQSLHMQVHYVLSKGHISSESDSVWTEAISDFGALACTPHTRLGEIRHFAECHNPPCALENKAPYETFGEHVFGASLNIQQYQSNTTKPSPPPVPMIAMLNPGCTLYAIVKSCMHGEWHP